MDLPKQSSINTRWSFNEARIQICFVYNHTKPIKVCSERGQQEAVGSVLAIYKIHGLPCHSHLSHACFTRQMTLVNLLVSISKDQFSLGARHSPVRLRRSSSTCSLSIAFRSPLIMISNNISSMLTTGNMLKLTVPPDSMMWLRIAWRVVIVQKIWGILLALAVVSQFYVTVNNTKGTLVVTCTRSTGHEEQQKPEWARVVFRDEALMQMFWLWGRNCQAYS